MAVGSELSLRAGLGLLDTRIVETTTPADPIRGNEFQRSPAMTAPSRWMAAHGTLALSVQGRYNGDYYSDDANTPALDIKAASVVDARASYDTRRWSMFGYVRNVFDKFYMTELISPVRGTAGDPLEFGFGFEARL